ncbi:unnamed protein product, partial [Candidula unifasciata]
LDYEEEISDVDDLTGWDYKAAVKHNHHSQRESTFVSYFTTVITTIITSVITTVTNTFS